MTTHQLYSENELLIQIAEGDEKAFEQLFMLYYRPLVFLGQRILDSREDGEDAVAQVFSRLWTGKEQLRQVQNIKAFLYTSVKNACLGLIRDQKKYPKQEIPDRLPDETTASAAELEITRAELVRLIHEQIQTLPEKCREIFILSYVHNLSTQEVAHTLNISVSNVTSQRSRAVQLLRKKIMHKDLWILLALLTSLK